MGKCTNCGNPADGSGKLCASCLKAFSFVPRDKHNAIAEFAAVLEKQKEQEALRWECNECGAQEYTMAVSEDDVHTLGCSRCGASEWHKEVAR